MKEQLELFEEEEEPLPSWGEILADTETKVILLGTVILFLVLTFTW